MDKKYYNAMPTIIIQGHLYSGHPDDINFSLYLYAYDMYSNSKY